MPDLSTPPDTCCGLPKVRAVYLASTNTGTRPVVVVCRRFVEAHPGEFQVLADTLEGTA